MTLERPYNDLTAGQVSPFSQERRGVPDGARAERIERTVECAACAVRVQVEQKEAEEKAKAAERLNTESLSVN